MNTMPMVFMTRFLGPDLKSRVNGNTKSAIVNMCSSRSDYPVKNLPLYSSTKSFSDVWS